MNGVDKVYRAWVEVEPGRTGSALHVPVYAKPTKTLLTDRTLTVELNPCPQRDALLRGVRWEEGASNFAGMFEGAARAGTIQLHASGDGYTLEQEDLDTAQITAWAIPQGADPKKLTSVIPIQVGGSGSHSITLKPGAKAECSPDLSGLSVRVRVLYPNSIVLLKEPADTLHAHLVVRCGDRLQYLGLPGCSFTSTGSALKLEFSPASMVCENLGE